jgi:hypothetical protein
MFKFFLREYSYDDRMRVLTLCDLGRTDEKRGFHALITKNLNIEYQVVDIIQRSSQRFGNQAGLVLPLRFSLCNLEHLFYAKA